MALLVVLHVLAVTVWVGGMFFAYMALRPAAATLLEPPQRLTLWADVFKRFFLWVWVSVALILITGFWMLFKYFGGMAGAPFYVHAMLGLGLLMMALYAHVFFVPYKRLGRAVAAKAWSEGAKHLGQIRFLVAVNTALGFVTIAVASGGRFMIP